MTFIFIGMPGSGKSSMGRIVAKKLRLKFIECDRLIEARAGKKLQDVINEDGIEHFRKLEEETLCSISDDNAIISTGGSVLPSRIAIVNSRPSIFFSAIRNCSYLLAISSEALRALTSSAMVIPTLEPQEQGLITQGRPMLLTIISGVASVALTYIHSGVFIPAVASRRFEMSLSIARRLPIYPEPE